MIATAAGFAGACEHLVDRQPAAIVALDPRNGRLRALVHPGLAAEQHPPGSVFKLVTGLAAIEAGRTAGPFRCPGWYRPHGGKLLRCWKQHGELAFEEALGQSCNVAFYGLGERVGAERLASTAVRLGLTYRPPHDPTALARSAIGEGPGVSCNLLQLAGLGAAIANGGTLFHPAWSPGAGTPVATPAVLDPLRTGMRIAVQHGSARLAACPGLALAGKTGTATYLDGSNRTYGWFVGYAPVDRPRLCVAVLQRESSGFQGAAALAKRVFQAWRAAGEP